MAPKLHRLGFKVYAGCLFKEGEGAKELIQHGIDVIQLDVTKEDEWDKAIEHIREQSSSLWGVVNNAGWSTFGDIEWTSMETYRKIIEINLDDL